MFFHILAFIIDKEKILQYLLEISNTRVQAEKSQINTEQTQQTQEKQQQ